MQARLEVRFFRTEAGNEPVRDWLRELPAGNGAPLAKT